MDNQNITRDILSDVIVNAARQAEAKRKLETSESIASQQMRNWLLRLQNNAVVNPDGKSVKDFYEQIGRGPVGFVKRIVRQMVWWYINPPLRKQTDVNKVLIAICKTLSCRVDELSSRNAELEKRICQIECSFNDFRHDIGSRINAIENQNGSAEN